MHIYVEIEINNGSFGARLVAGIGIENLECVFYFPLGSSIGIGNMNTYSYFASKMSLYPF
jgi:hypothetical protein